jgi:predicted DsbA family dithiol-disulfide isomerase
VEEGLDATEVREALESDRYVDAVRRDLEEARMLGVTGVPFFVIAGRYAISGAQATEVFTRALAMTGQASESPPR